VEQVKVGILAGGIGSRLSEETILKPKPMVEIGGRPILWHIMMHYSHYGFDEFAIALGYKGEFIKKYMADLWLYNRDFMVDLSSGSVHLQPGQEQHWKVHLVDTGQSTMTGGRIKRLRPYLGDGTFMLTWGDGVSTVDLHELLAFHRSHGKLATVTAVRPPARFGCLELEADQVVSFTEKPQTGEGWINGAFFVLEPGVFNYIDNDLTPFEREPMERLAQEGQLMAYRHWGFWQCMDTIRDKVRLDELWETGAAPWKLWD
jgi:glucose-1-phosphate cytidylyltransferase